MAGNPGAWERHRPRRLTGPARQVGADSRQSPLCARGRPTL